MGERQKVFVVSEGYFRDLYVGFDVGGRSVYAHKDDLAKISLGEEELRSIYFVDSREKNNVLLGEICDGRLLDEISKRWLAKSAYFRNAQKAAREVRSHYRGRSF